MRHHPRHFVTLWLFCDGQTGLPSNVRSRSLAMVLAYEKWPIRASLQPLGVYIYAVGSQSCALRLKRLRCARLAAAKLAAHGTSGIRRAAIGLGLSPAPCTAAPVVFAAIRAAMPRRRDTGSLPCDVSHRASDEPRRCMSLSSALAPSSLASPSIRRVFLRSICARRRSVSSLNLVRVSPGAKRSRRRRAQCGVQIRR